ncbi:MAG: hypothetical protein KFH98_02760 [Gemmatimonadetes bacterium]|nr:hypothetical protein [Gemmatimonadota bacterium]
MKGIVMAATALLVVAACGNDGLPDDQATGSIDSAAWRQAQDLPPDVRAAIDSGNAAFRANDYAAAREQYLRATELAPEQSAGWFGLSMAEGQLGNAAAADSAMQRVHALNPGASLIERGSDTSSRAHP